MSQTTNWAVVVYDNYATEIDPPLLSEAQEVSLQYAKQHGKDYIQCYSDVRVLLKDMTEDDMTALQLITDLNVIIAPPKWVEIMTETRSYPRSTHYER